MTQYLGFPHYGDEYKVMGLAPYGEPRFMAEMRELVRLQDGGRFCLDLNFSVTPKEDRIQVGQLYACGEALVHEHAGSAPGTGA
jgi:predicted NodU family carbamoyl transferase